jgi:DNA-binding LacI/PurR family transcriptional regulator
LASLRDIADASGFSIRTVSRVIKGKGSVSKAAREKILECVKTLNYRPNLMARSLKTGRSHTICVILSTIDELAAEKIESFELYMREHGYLVNLLFAPKGEVEGGEDGAIDSLFTEVMKYNPAGAALFNIHTAPLVKAIERIIDYSIPYITFDMQYGSFDSVRINRRQGVYEAVRYLSEKGYQNIAYLGKRSDDNRLDGYHRAMSEYAKQPVYIGFESEFNARQAFVFGEASAEEFVNMENRPDAVQCFSDVIALGFMAGLNKRGIKIPEDVAVVGFDDRSAAALCYPSLTTVAQPNKEVGLAAAEVLLNKINQEPPESGEWSRKLPAKLVIRDSA